MVRTEVAAVVLVRDMAAVSAVEGARRHAMLAGALVIMLNDASLDLFHGQTLGFDVIACNWLDLLKLFPHLCRPSVSDVPVNVDGPGVCLSVSKQESVGTKGRGFLSTLVLTDFTRI